MNDEQKSINKINRIKKEIAKLEKIERTEENKAEYAEVQYKVAGFYRIGLNDYSKAELYYLNVKQEDSEERYVAAQFMLALLYHFKFKNYEKAKNCYLNVTKYECKFLIYSSAQYGLGIIYYFEDKNYEKAVQHFKKVKFSAFGDNEYSIAQLILSFIELKKEFDRELEDRLNDYLWYIKKNIENITKELFVKLVNNPSQYERKVAHYTKPEVLFSLLKNESNLRLNLVDFTNDPKESKVLTNWLGIKHNQQMAKVKSFVTSFSFNHNSLNQFRLYGLEDGINGSGVSVVFNSDFFHFRSKTSNIKNIANYLDSKKINIENQKLKDEIKNEAVDNDKTLFKLPLYRCVYFDPESQYLAIAKRNKQSFYAEFAGEDPKEIEKRWNAYIKEIKEDEKVKIIRRCLNDINAK